MSDSIEGGLLSGGQRSKRQRFGAWCLLLAVGLAAGFAAGCAANPSYVHPDADMGFYEKVGVLPFATLGADRLAGDKMSSSFTTHLLVARRMQVAEPGQFLASYLKQMGENTAPPIGLPQEKLTAIAQETGVQGVFEGTVRDFDFTRGSAPRPMISVEVRLVDVATGNIVWSTSVTRVGSATIPILGIGGVRTLAELTEEVAAELVGRLPG
jgi:polysaccharide biosynthesis protein PelC